jgi:hypothetical protein
LEQRFNERRSKIRIGNVIKFVSGLKFKVKQL